MCKVRTKDLLAQGALREERPLQGGNQVPSQFWYCPKPKGLLPKGLTQAWPKIKSLVKNNYF
jgi:hypothetical protein